MRLSTGAFSISDVLAQRAAARAKEDSYVRRHKDLAERADLFGMNFCVERRRLIQIIHPITSTMKTITRLFIILASIVFVTAVRAATRRQCLNRRAVCPCRHRNSFVRERSFV